MKELLPFELYGKDRNHVRTEAGASEFRVVEIKNKELAEFIVRACNSHYELVDELSRALGMIDTAHKVLNLQDDLGFIAKRMRGVLAKARGEG